MRSSIPGYRPDGNLGGIWSPGDVLILTANGASRAQPGAPFHQALPPSAVSYRVSRTNQRSGKLPWLNEPGLLIWTYGKELHEYRALIFVADLMHSPSIVFIVEGAT